MIKKYVLAFILFLFILVGGYLVGNNVLQEIVEVKDVVANGGDNIQVRDIKEVTDNYEIKVFYPVTPYEELNKEILKQIQGFVEEFRADAKELHASFPEMKLDLEINFNTEEYKDILSIVFTRFVDLGGAHPNTYISSIVWDTKTQKQMTIKDLQKKNKNILKELSRISYEKIIADERLKDQQLEDYVKRGTEAIEENFKNFAFTKEGLKIYFERYQVAPYAYGDFDVTIPYASIGLLDK